MLAIREKVNISERRACRLVGLSRSVLHYDAKPDHAGRSRETARAFFEQLPEGVAERIEAVAIDMTTAYELEIKEQCPQAEIVFDLYHVVAKYGREPDGHARRRAPSSNNSPKAGPSASKRSQST